jgi:hypothetical protein
LHIRDMGGLDQLRLERGIMTTHVDGDDYTWQAGPVQAGPVLKPDAQPGSDAAWAQRWQPSGTHDLRTLAEREQDDVAALRADLDRLAELVRLTTGPVDVALQVDAQRDQIIELVLRCDNLVDALAAMGGRVAALERTVAALVKVLEVRL